MHAMRDALQQVARETLGLTVHTIIPVQETKTGFLFGMAFFDLEIRDE